MSSKAAAESLYQEAVELTEVGNFEPACEKFAASQQLDPTVGTLLRLADCYEHIGRVVSAWSTFSQAEGLARAQQQLERAELARNRAEQLVDQLSYVTLELPDDPASELVIRLGSNEVPQAVWGARVPVDPGTSTLTATAPGRKAWTASVVIEPRGQVTVQVPQLALVPALKKVPPPSVPIAQPIVHEPEVSGANSTGWILGGAGVLGLAGGGVLGYLAHTLNEDSMAECRTDELNICSERGVRLRNDAGKLADVATVTLAAGGALVITGAILLLTGNTGEDSDPVTDADKRRKTTQVAVGLQPLERGGALNQKKHKI